MYLGVIVGHLNKFLRGPGFWIVACGGLDLQWSILPVFGTAGKFSDLERQREKAYVVFFLDTERLRAGDMSKQKCLVYECCRRKHVS